MTKPSIPTQPVTIPADISRREALALMRRGLSGAGLPTPGLDARLLMAHALGIAAAELLAHDDLPLDARAAADTSGLLARRLNGESVARIIGQREFWGLPFRLSPDTLEPRPDTETLIEAVLESRPDRGEPLRILDLGTGSGCILIALLTEYPNATGTGVDVSTGAVAAATENAYANGVGQRAVFLISDWFEQIDGQFDLIVSNPPYIRSAAIGGLDREVRAYDPPRALDGGTDGLDAYRHIVARAPAFLNAGGRVLLEIGFDQKRDLETIGRQAGFHDISCRNDLAGHPRVITLAEHRHSTDAGL